MVQINVENLLFTFTKKNPSEFLVEQRAKSNEQRAKSNEQRATSEKFHLYLNEAAGFFKYMWSFSGHQALKG